MNSDQCPRYHDHNDLCFTCGLGCDYSKSYSDGSTYYYTAEHVARYRALYGEPLVPYVPIGKE